MQKKLFFVVISLFVLLGISFLNTLPAHAVIYVTNSNLTLDKITTWSNNNTTGNISPTTTIAGAATTFNGPFGVAVDANWIYVANNGNNSIDVFPVGATGNQAPTRSIQGGLTTFNGPFGVAVDTNWIYVASINGNNVAVFPVGATGNVAPTRSIQGAATSLSFPTGVAVDTNWIYVANYGNNSIDVFPVGATGNQAPTRSIQGGLTTFSGPTGVAVDANWIYVANQNNLSIDVFQITDTSNVAPTRSIQGVATSLSFPTDVAVDANWIYVANDGNNSIGVFQITDTGNVAPTRSIQGGLTTLDGPAGIAVTCPMSFSDVSGHWAYNYIEAIFCASITTGFPDNTYRPEDQVTRAQMAAFIIRALYGESFTYSGTPHFPDCSPGDWEFKYVQRLFEDGITTGFPDGTYGPDGVVTRAQMAAFLIRALYGESFSYSGTPHFPDVSAGHWAFKYVQRLFEDGITTGFPDGTYGPEDVVTRAQMAAFLSRAFLGMP